MKKETKRKSKKKKLTQEQDQPKKASNEKVVQRKREREKGKWARIRKRVHHETTRNAKGEVRRANERNKTAKATTPRDYHTSVDFKDSQTSHTKHTHKRLRDKHAEAKTAHDT